MPATTDTPLFDLTLAEQRRQEGTDRALDAERAWPWKAHAEQVIYDLASSGKAFTADDVIAVVGLPDGGVGMNRNNAVGSLFTACAKRGWIKSTGHYVKSRRVTNHGAIIAVWAADPDHDF